MPGSALAGRQAANHAVRMFLRRARRNCARAEAAVNWVHPRPANEQPTWPSSGCPMSKLPFSDPNRVPRLATQAEAL